MSYRDTIKAFIQYADDIERVFRSTIPWESKHDMIFGLIAADEPVPVEWECTDNSPEGEVRGYAEAVEALAAEYKSVFPLEATKCRENDGV